MRLRIQPFQCEPAPALERLDVGRELPADEVERMRELSSGERFALFLEALEDRALPGRLATLRALVDLGVSDAPGNLDAGKCADIARAVGNGEAFLWQVEVLHLCLEAGLDPEYLHAFSAENPEKKTLLEVAAQLYDPEGVELMLGAGAKPLSQDEINRLRALSPAQRIIRFINCLEECDDLLQLQRLRVLVDLGVRRDMQGLSSRKRKARQKAMALAVCAPDALHRLGLLHLALEAGLDPDCAGLDGGHSLLTFFAKRSMFDHVDLLLRAGANPMLEDDAERLPLMAAIEAQAPWAERERIANRLLQAGASLCIAGQSRTGHATSGYPVWARIVFREDIADLFAWVLDHGVSPDATDPQGDTLMHYAVCSLRETGGNRFMEDLVARGVPLDMPNNEQVTPLCQAVSMGSFTVARNLIALGANIRYPPPKGFAANAPGVHILLCMFSYLEVWPEAVELLEVVAARHPDYPQWRVGTGKTIQQASQDAISVPLDPDAIGAWGERWRNGQEIAACWAPYIQAAAMRLDTPLPAAHQGGRPARRL